MCETRDDPVIEAILQHELREQDNKYRDFHPSLPPRALVDQHVAHFFDHINLFYPFFHRSLFVKQLDTDMGNPHFVATVLLVCAITARRVDPTSGLASGSDYYNQVQPFLRASPPQSPQLYDVQIYLVRLQLF